MGKILDSDWSRENLLRSDWLGLIGASITTNDRKGLETGTKDGVKEMEHEFSLGIFRPEKEDFIFKCSSVAP